MGGLIASRKAYGQTSGINTQPYTAVAAASSIAIGNVYYSTPTGNDWATVSSTLQGMYKDWTANGYDAQLQPYYASMTTSQVSLSNPNLNLNAILQNIQQFQPAFTLTDLQNALSYINQLSPSDIAGIVQTLQTNGLSYYLSQGSQVSLQVAVNLGWTGIPSKSRPGGPVQPLPGPSDTLGVQSKHLPHLQRAAFDTNNAHLLQVGLGSRGWGFVAAAMFIAGVTIGAMASGGILLLAGWGVVAGALGTGSGIIGAAATLFGNC